MLYHRPFPLGVDRRDPLWHFRRNLLLVSEGAPAACSSGAAGPLALLAGSTSGLLFDVRADAHFGLSLGMPRRIYTYDADRGWEFWNQLTTLGALLQTPSYAIFVYNVIVSLWKGQPAGNDPWDAWTLEWTTTSPPPSYNFEVIPEVHSRRPLWDLKHPRRSGLWKYE